MFHAQFMKLHLDLWPRLTFKRIFPGHESENGAYLLNGCS